MASKNGLLQCDACGSESAASVAGIEGVYECLVCGHYFEDDLYEIRNTRPGRKRYDDDDWD